FKVIDNTYNDRFKILSYHTKTEDINFDFLRELSSSPSIEKVEGEKTTRTRKEENYPCISNYIDISNIKHNDLGETIIDTSKNITFEIVGITTNNVQNSVDAQGVIIPLMGEAIELQDGNSSIAFDIGTSNSFAAIKTANTVENLSNYSLTNQDLSPHFVLLNEPSKDAELHKKFDINQVNPIYGVVQD